jgi:hypothetical protein
LHTENSADENGHLRAFTYPFVGELSVHLARVKAEALPVSFWVPDDHIAALSS